MNSPSKYAFRFCSITLLVLASKFAYSQGLCDKNHWPLEAIEDGFKNDGEITADCSPLTVKLKDHSAGTDIRYDFYYNGRAAHALDKVGNKDSVNALFSSTHVEVYRILQYGKKNGKDMFACKTIDVRPNNKPVFSYSTCNNNFLNLNLPQIPANNFDHYTIEWGDNSPIQTITTLPFSANKPYSVTAKTIRIKGENSIPTGCSTPPFQTILMNADGNVLKITQLEVLAGSNKANLTFTGTFDTEEIYHRTPTQHYSLPNFKYQSNHGTITFDLINNQQTCFMVYKYVACPQLSGEIGTIRLGSIEPFDTNSNRIKWQEIQNNQTSTILNTSKIKNVIYNLDRQMLERNNKISQKTLNVSSIFEHPILNCEAKYCYQVVAKVQGEWSVNPTVPYSTISKSEIKCIDRKTILAPPLSEGRVGVIDADVIELEFQDNSSWPANKDQYFLYKYILEVNTKIDSFVASQSKKFSLKDNTTAESLCYKVGYKDMCGSESALSEPMSTIYLQASEDDELDWTTNAPFGNSTIQSFELRGIDENTSTEFIEKILGQNTKNTSLDISNKEIEAKYKIRALGKGNINSLSNQISIPIEALFLVLDVFTPNYDNMNKLLEIKGKFGRVNGYKLTISDRWGNSMKEITDESGNGDRKHNGTPLPSATYFYKLSIGLTGNESFMKQGKFELLR